MPVRIVFRKDTAANWAAINPILLDGELGLCKTEEGSYRFKIGDGVTPWNDLDFWTDTGQI